MSPYSPQEFTSWLKDCSCHGWICRRDLVWAAPFLLVRALEEGCQGSGEARAVPGRRQEVLPAQTCTRGKSNSAQLFLGSDGRDRPPSAPQLPYPAPSFSWWESVGVERGRIRSCTAPHTSRFASSTKVQALCSLSPSGDTVVSEEGFTPAQGAGAHHRRGQPGWALTGDSSRALQPGGFPPANGSEKESVKKGPKRPAEGCGFWSAGTSGQSTGDLC